MAATETITMQPGTDGVYAPASSTEQSTQHGLTDEQVQQHAAGFDRQFGSNAYEFLNARPEPTQDYKFSAKATDGRHVEQTLTASSLEAATLQSWDVIQQHQRNGTQIETARIDWSNDQGPQVSYIYDRRQGIEISRPNAVDLQNTPTVPEQLQTHEHHRHSPVNRQHEEQQQQENSIGFGY